MRAAGLGKTATKRAADSLLREGVLIEVRPTLLRPAADPRAEQGLPILGKPRASIRAPSPTSFATTGSKTVPMDGTVSVNGTKQYPRTALNSIRGRHHPQTRRDRGPTLTSSADAEDAAVAAPEARPARGRLCGTPRRPEGRRRLFKQPRRRSGHTRPVRSITPRATLTASTRRLCERICHEARLCAHVSCDARLPVCQAALVEVFATIAEDAPGQLARVAHGSTRRLRPGRPGRRRDPEPLARSRERPLAEPLRHRRRPGGPRSWLTSATCSRTTSTPRSRCSARWSSTPTPSRSPPSSSSKTTSIATPIVSCSERSARCTPSAKRSTPSP